MLTNGALTNQGQRRANVPALVAAPTAEQSRAAFFEAIERLEAVVEAETGVLGLNKASRLDEFNHRKSRGLLDLNRVIKGVPPGLLGEEGRQRLDGLRSKLERNLGVLQMHLTAVRDVAALISRAMEEADSDGTYSGRPVQTGRR